MEQTNARINNNLQTIRQVSGLPRFGLAALARVSTTTIAQIERFNYVPGYRVQRALAEALKVSTSDIWPAAAPAEQEEID